MGLVPFIAGDIAKVVLAAAIVRAVVPERAFGWEVDGDRWAGWRIP